MRNHHLHLYRRPIESTLQVPRMPPVPGRTAPQRGSLGAIIGAFKSVTAKRINTALGRSGGTIWQRGYYERVIRRHGGEYGRIAQYIAENPANWR
jgi:putative transposase